MSADTELALRLAKRIGCGPIDGGRRLGELTIRTPYTNKDCYWIEVDGEMVTEEQVKLIRMVLREPHIAYLIRDAIKSTVPFTRRQRGSTRYASILSLTHLMKEYRLYENPTQSVDADPE